MPKVLRDRPAGDHVGDVAYMYKLPFEKESNRKLHVFVFTNGVIRGF